MFILHKLPACAENTYRMEEIMLNLNDRNWTAFFINDLFIVKRPKPRSEKQYQSGNVPFVASGNFNNGVIKCCAPNFDESLEKGNCITISPVDGSAFYQESDFLGRGGAGSSILLLYCDKINRYSGLFITKMISQTCKKYCYGKMGSQQNIKREKIMLPTDKYGYPDYDFMEKYIKERERQLIQKYTDFICNTPQIVEAMPPLESLEWDEFFLTDLFTEIKRGKRLKKEHHINGNMPYISSSALSNGVDNFIANKDNVRIFSDCLTLANSGSVGSCFYHPYHFVASDHVTSLYNPKFNRYHYLFLSTIICRVSEKYNFNREINDMRISKEKILLPIDKNGLPDYDYMEQYGKYIMLKKYQQYLDYKNTDPERTQ